ncbi:MAG TPA: ABC transporter ATP-binding protein [Isosphaeraceae bacterium]|nr:ABC transporter ATP-binding protein [Isosphaeraceae bacterium]
MINPAGSRSRPVVAIRDLRKTYVMGHAPSRGGPSTTVTVHALRGVSVDFYSGEYVAIMGASGSGKSTMLNLLGCLDRPSSGQYILGDTDVARLSDDELSEIRSRYIGFIFQSYNLIQQYTVYENIQIPLTYQGDGRITQEVHERTLELARLVGLSDRLDHRPNQLSGGQQQRVAIARSLVNNPYIVLADEATGNLDTTTSEEIMTMLGRLNDAGKTIIMVTHEDDIAEHAKRIIRMRDGVIIEDGPSPRMLAQAQAAEAGLAAASAGLLPGGLELEAL